MVVSSPVVSDLPPRYVYRFQKKRIKKGSHLPEMVTEHYSVYENMDLRRLHNLARRFTLRAQER